MKEGRTRRKREREREREKRERKRERKGQRERERAETPINNGIISSTKRIKNHSSWDSSFHLVVQE